MLDIAIKTGDFIMHGGVEPAIYDARRLLKVAALPCMTMELTGPVLDAAANHIALIVEAVDGAYLSDALAEAVDEAEGALAAAVAAVADANQGGDIEAARAAMGSALTAVEALFRAAAGVCETVCEAA